MKDDRRHAARCRFCSEEEAAEVLRAGGVVAFATETSYGLAVDPFNAGAVEKLFRLKERDRGKPILILVEDRDMLQTVISSIPRGYEELMEKHWPGPLTLVFPADASIPESVSGGTGKIGVRISSSPAAARLLQAWKRPVTATSANKAGGDAACSAAEVEAIFGDWIDCLVDGGETPGGPSSTVVDSSGGELTVLRQGKVSLR